MYEHTEIPQMKAAQNERIRQAQNKLILTGQQPPLFSCLHTKGSRTRSMDLKHIAQSSFDNFVQ